jgi:hypothetical protein
MSDSYGEPQQQGAQGDGSRGDGYRGEGGRGGGRGPGNREGGGFRIRLSENEMRSARALQEAFNLRSTVAVLGFALRTLGQMLEDGQLDELIEQQRNQAPRGRREGGGRDGGGRDGGGRGRRSDDDRQGGRGSRPDPFARPAKPQPEPEPTPEPESTPEEATPSDAPAEDTPAEASTDLPNEEESKAATPEA